MQPSTTPPPHHPPKKSLAINDRQLHGEIRVNQVFSATPSEVFRAWLDPALAGRWLFATATRPMTEVSIMAQVGGQFRFTDGQVLHTGRYIHIAAPRELVFSLDDTRSCSRVDVKFAPRGAGCLLRLAHDGLLPELSNYARERWLGMLYGLSLVLDEASKSPRWPSSSIRASRPPLTRG